MLDDLLRESGVAALWREEGKQEGLREGELRGELRGKLEGELKGKLEGELRGKLEGKRELARLALEARFGALSADIVSALQTVDEATLVATVTHLATDTPEQARVRLGLRSA